MALIDNRLGRVQNRYTQTFMVLGVLALAGRVALGRLDLFDLGVAVLLMLALFGLFMLGPIGGADFKVADRAARLLPEHLDAGGDRDLGYLLGPRRAGVGAGRCGLEASRRDPVHDRRQRDPRARPRSPSNARPAAIPACGGSCSAPACISSGPG